MSRQGSEQGGVSVTSLMTNHAGVRRVRTVRKAAPAVSGVVTYPVALPQLSEFVTAQRRQHTVFPRAEHVFSWASGDVSDVKVVILGQDPYHGPGQAHGETREAQAQMGRRGHMASLDQVVRNAQPPIIGLRSVTTT